MKRQHIIGVIVGIAAVLLVTWIARNTYWDQVTLPAPLRGEAARNPYYAAQSFAQKLGATTSLHSAFPSPGQDAVIFLTDWTWNLGGTRRAQLESWVESGGRLVIDASVYSSDEALQNWSGVEFYMPKISAAEIKRRAADEVGSCDDWQQSGAGPINGDEDNRTYLLCDVASGQRVRATRQVSWAVRDRDGMLALRVAVGKGSVTALASQPFAWRNLLSGDHADLLVATTQLHNGDHIHFLSEGKHPSFIVLAWRHGAPVILLGAVALLLWLWRASVRFGPLLPQALAPRRSLAEQIRGTGQFTLRQGGAALHAAAVRATTTAAKLRIPGFSSMSSTQQVAAMAELAGVGSDEIAAALAPAANRKRRHLLSTMALLEAVRRKILAIYPGKSNGK
jgi:hypothetical protein